MIVPAHRRAGLGQVGDQGSEVEGHVDAGVGPAEVLPFSWTFSAPCSLPSFQPSPSASGVTATGDKAEAGLDWKKPKPLASSAGIRLRRRHVVDQADQADGGQRLLAADALRHVAGDHRDLGLQVAAPGLVGQRDGIARGQEAVGAALVHQRVGPEALGHLGAARLPHQGDVVHIGRAVGPLIGARQGRGGLALVEAVRAARRRAPGSRPGRADRARHRSQSSSAACSVGAIRKASVNQARSLETTTRRPSRPCLSEASFMALR